MSINKNGLLAGKVAVITGASRGIGEAIAIRYAMEGAKVVVSARTVDDGDHILAGSMNSVVKRINDAGGEAAAVRCDMALAEDRVQLIETTKALFGSVDIVVNNAAVTYFIPISEFPEKRQKLMFEVQVHGPLHLAQLAMENMRERYYLVTTPDIPWEKDVLRESKDDRGRLLQRHVKLLSESNSYFKKVSGNQQFRLETAINVINTLLQ